jgi:predicted HTH transcriptional regulator
MYENLTDLLKQIALGEDSVLELKTVEFSGDKIAGPHRSGMADELAAMANTASGVIVLGVDDKTRAVQGIPAEKLDIVESWIRFDEQPVPNTSADNLNPQLWSRFRTVLSSSNDHDFLEKMKLITKDAENAVRATVGGLLLACDSPDTFLSNAFIQAVCYRGSERNAVYQLDARDIVGPLDIQIREACKFVERNMRVFATKAPWRIETPQFSMNAVFEAVVNAVAHRDYSIYGSKIRLHVFADRLELFSPGTIPNTMTVESISERQSARNELISSLLARCPMNVDAYRSRRAFIMDKRGEGVPIILSESKELSGRLPEYRLIDDAELLLTIYAAQPPQGKD